MLSPYSALSLVRRRIHALRQSTELFEGSPYSAICLVQQRIQVHASDYGGWFCWCLFTSRSALFLVGRPMKLGIMACMP